LREREPEAARVAPACERRPSSFRLCRDRRTGEHFESDVALEPEAVGERQRFAEDGQRPEERGVRDELRGRPGARRADVERGSEFRQERMQPRCVLLGGADEDHERAALGLADAAEYGRVDHSHAGRHGVAHAHNG